MLALVHIRLISANRDARDSEKSEMPISVQRRIYITITLFWIYTIVNIDTWCNVNAYIPYIYVICYTLCVCKKICANKYL